MPKGFYRDPELKFDLDKMQSALKEVDSRVARQSPLGERDINAICLTQIPNDPNSITGGNVRGLYWTKPDSTYKEVQREEVIDEVQYSEFVKLFEDTYFKEMYDAITKKYKLGRVRLLWKLPRTTLSWHRDPEPRLHIPIVSNFLNLFANSSLVPTPSVHETITGSLIFNLLISNNEPNPPITSLSKEFFVFLTPFFDIKDMCFTNLFANEIFTPLFL